VKSKRNKMSSEYTIIKAFTLDALIRAVNEKIKAGWKPIGSAQELQPSPDTPVAGWFFQTMLLEPGVEIHVE
jgi:hypothetical protein